jgi:protein O-GlcNAc transferase
MMEGKVNDAMDLYQCVYLAFPKHEQLEYLGNIHFYRREFQKAVDLYEAAIKINPAVVIPRYQYFVGLQEEREGNFVEAFERYQAAIDTEPQFLDPYFALGALLIQVNDFCGAYQCYQDILRIKPDEMPAYYNLKQVLINLVKDDPERYSNELDCVSRICNEKGYQQ